jgi:protein-disulfide isomerase
LLDKYPDDIKLVLKNFPLPMHPFARKAAAAALAANNQGKYWEFSHKLFENSSSLSDSKIQDIAKQLGLDLEKFNRDLNDASVQSLINKDISDAERASVRGTPTIFVNGKALKNRRPNEFQEMLETELKKKKID